MSSDEAWIVAALCGSKSSRPISKRIINFGVYRHFLEGQLFESNCFLYKAKVKIFFEVNLSKAFNFFA